MGNKLFTSVEMGLHKEIKKMLAFCENLDIIIFVREEHSDTK